MVLLEVIVDIVPDMAYVREELTTGSEGTGSDHLGGCRLSDDELLVVTPGGTARIGAIAQKRC